jgi:gluconate 5-dehydrogenase
VSDWDATFNINVRGVMLCCVEFIRHMQERHYGKIINLSSIRGHGAAPGGGQALAYGTSKSAVDMITKQLAAEFAKDGITINAIGPTVVKTPMMEKTMTAEFEARMAAKIPMGRIQMPDDCAGPAVFLASDASAFITGTTLYVDGGLSNVS